MATAKLTLTDKPNGELSITLDFVKDDGSPGADNDSNAHHTAAQLMQLAASGELGDVLHGAKFGANGG